MNRARWLAFGLCVAGSMMVAWSLNWFTAQLASESEPGRLAYAPFEHRPPPVDLASIQRGWPNRAGEPGETSRMRTYLHDMEGQVPLPAAGPQTASAPTQQADLGTLLASADANAGKQKAQACRSCHDFEAGGPDRIGPNLWQVVGRDIASRPGFSYSTAMAAQKGYWTYDRLFDFLAHPARTIPGTRMSFPGFPRPEDRAAVIRFLASLGGKPPPFPQPGGGADVKAR